ncbi:glycosyltransferase [Paenisporosarcina sp. TG-14]|uniref:glycosyltransferase n=1 Tax=Paenisporosarcina sp. TG-14 TaxID=1231057 RepID=UPI0003104C52|nr:glycosyltransferase [Paenisporosarcina sp. TG-14]
MKKKILFAIPTLGGGGAEKVLVTLLNNLDENKYEITLFSMFDSGINKKYLNNDIKYRYYFKKLFKGNIHILKLLSPKLLYRLMIKEEYDIIISYLEGPTTRILSGSPKHKTRLINWIHTEINNQKTVTQSYRSLKEAVKTYNKFETTVFVSNTARIAFENTFNEIKGNLIVKYNTVDTTHIINKSKEKINEIEFDSNKINLISVGRFIKQKGYIRLLKIMHTLINENINIHLYLIGKGELENKYYETIQKFNLDDHVTIMGFKDNPYKYVRNSDIFVCSSYEEGYSTAVSESLILGTPVVTTLCSGMEEMMGSNSEYGLITENSEEALYKGLKRILTEPKLLEHYKLKVKERRELFSTEKTVGEVEELLDRK